MNAESYTTLAVLAAAMLLLGAGWLRMDVVAMLVVGALAVTNTLSATDALAGFGNPAVVTVWAMFILSAGLERSGVAGLIGRQVARRAGHSELRVTAAIMLTGAVLSAFMNNIGVAALMLPVVMDIARQTRTAPSRLLMPLAFSTLLGGLTTIFTTSNILASEALRAEGLRPFGPFHYTPTGLPAMLCGVAFVAWLGRRLLPVRDTTRASLRRGAFDLGASATLTEQSFVMRLPRGSPLAGRTLGHSRLRSALGLTVVGILRDDQAVLAPGPATELREADRLVVQGSPEYLEELRGWQELKLAESSPGAEFLCTGGFETAVARVAEGSPLAGSTLREAGFRDRFGAQVLAVRCGGTVRRTNLPELPLRVGDELLALAPQEKLGELQTAPEFAGLRRVDPGELSREWRLQERLFVMDVPAGSRLAGRTLAESRLGDAFGLVVVGIIHGDGVRVMPRADQRLSAGDRLLVEGRTEDLAVLRALQALQIESDKPPGLRTLESAQVGGVEAILSPRSTLAGKTLRQLRFRERYGLLALAIWRDGRAHRAHIRDLPLRFGDALLLYGPREKLRLLAAEPDFIVLTEAVQEPPDTSRAGRAALIMLAVLAPVVVGWLPISIAAVLGAMLMVLTRCLSMEEAYRAIDWRSVFLIAGMLSLGTALQQTGLADLAAETLVNHARPLGVWPVVVGLYLLATLGACLIPSAALVVLIAPVALKTSVAMNASPHTFMMAIAMAASASFLSPVSHPANVLVMGPGGYRFSDYLKLGAPLTLVVMVVVFLVLPWVWPP
jgi:di/tricarboxylate transporter